MSYIVSVAGASLTRECYAAAGVEPEQDGCYVMIPPLTVSRQLDGRYAYVLPDTVRVFASWAEAMGWIRRRKAFQRRRRRVSGPIRVVNLANARMPSLEHML